MLLRLFLYIGYYLVNVAFAKDITAFWLTLPTMAIVLFNVTRLQSKYFAVEDMIVLVIYLYMVISPLQQIDHGHIGVDGPVSPITYNIHYMVVASLISAIFYFLFTVGLEMLKHKRLAPVSFELDRRWAQTMLLIVTASCVLYVLLTGGLGNVLASRYEKTGEGSILGLPLQATQQVGTFILASFVGARIDRYLLYFLIALFLLLIIANPFNTPRFFLIATYVPLFLVLVRGRISAAAFYAGTMGMIVIAMPILSISSRLGKVENVNSAIGNSSILNLPFLDVYDMLVECARYTSVNGFTYGAKIIGDIGFMIPRAYWTSKPTLNALDIGGELADDRIAGTSNLSMFFAGDGYRDLGYFGVAIVAAIMVIIVHLMVFRKPKIINGMPLMRYIFIASLPILIRGPISAVLPLFFLQAAVLAAFSWLFAPRRGESASAAPRKAPHSSDPSGIASL